MQISKIKTSVLLCFLFWGSLVSCDSPAITFDQHEKSCFDDIDKDSTLARNDFFKYVNGAWADRKKMEADVVNSSFMLESKQHVDSMLRQLLAKASPESSSGVEALLAKMYRSAMDTATIEQLGNKPILRDIEVINNIQNKVHFYDVVLMNMRSGIPALFTFDAVSLDQSKYSLIVRPAPLTLKSSSMYTSNEKISRGLRAEFKKYIKKVLMYSGQFPLQAEVNAASVYDIEVNLAKIHSRSYVSQPFSGKDYSIGQLEELAPNIYWTSLFDKVRSSKLDSVHVLDIDYFKKLSAYVNTVPNEKWKQYLIYRYVYYSSRYLDSKISNLTQEFVEQSVNGKEFKLYSRWRQVERSLTLLMFDAISKHYSDNYLDSGEQKDIQRIVRAIINEYKTWVHSSSWLSSSTKGVLASRLDSMRIQVGFEGAVNDYSGLTLALDSYHKNALNLNTYNFDNKMQMVGKRFDFKRFTSLSRLVDCKYHIGANLFSINAGMIQEPLYFLDSDDAAKFGRIGQVIGHHLAHFVDVFHKFDEAIYFDEEREIADTSIANYRKRLLMVVEEYDSIKVGQDIYVNGRAISREAFIDLLASEAVYRAFKKTPSGRANKKRFGFTAQQRYFIHKGISFRTFHTEKYLQNLVKFGMGLPGKNRFEVLLRNSGGFQEVYKLKKGDQLYTAPDDRLVLMD